MHIPPEILHARDAATEVRIQSHSQGIRIRDFAYLLASRSLPRSPFDPSVSLALAPATAALFCSCCSYSPPRAIPSCASVPCRCGLARRINGCCSTGRGADLLAFILLGQQEHNKMLFVVNIAVVVSSSKVAAAQQCKSLQQQRYRVETPVSTAVAQCSSHSLCCYE